ncbi:MAG: hypothetical protein GXY88_05520 [Tissierellia bacterium]|nr:hypothetical protein [Tissierellia bacterium]
MGKIKVYFHSSLTNEQLLDWTIEEIDQLKILDQIKDLNGYKKKVSRVNQWIAEVKRRNISLEGPLLMRRIFIW